MPESSGFVSPPAPLRSVPGYSGIQNGLQDEFSWLDLQAVGELVSGNGGNGYMQGFGNMDSGYVPFMNMGGGGEWGDLGILDGDDVGRFF